MTRRVLLVVFLALFGCSYTAEAERAETDLIEGDGECPAKDGELVSTTVLTLTPLCFYRLTLREDASANTRSYCDDEKQTLAAVRNSAAYAFKPSESGTRNTRFGMTRCTTDGVVFEAQAEDATCPATLTLPRAYARDYEAGELLATDERTPYRVCNYEVTYEYQRQPFGCGNTHIFSP